MSAIPMRIPIRFDPAYRVLSSALFISPEDSYLEFQDDQVNVRMAWAFRARFPRSAVASTAMGGFRPFSRGVHGIAGRWLVNGSGQGIVVIDLEPSRHARVLGFKVKLRQLMVSVDEPERLIAALKKAP